MEYFRKLRELLEKERSEDREQYRQLTERSSVFEKRGSGLCWYPVAIRGTEITRGDYLSVELERTTHQHLPHQLRFGMPASLFSNHDARQNRIDGVITHIGENRLTLTLRTEELPDWSDDGKLGVDLLFDNNSYEEMFEAIRLADNIAESGRESRLVDIIIGKQVPSFQVSGHLAGALRLNDSQQRAVNSILNANDLAVVHGPPGTGKTTTLVEAIRQMVNRDHRQVLVVAPSNAAVDLLSEKLSAAGLNTLRIGNPARVSEKLIALTLDARTALHPRMKEVRSLRKQANEFRNMAHKYKRHFGKAEREQRKALFDAAHKILKDISNTEQYVVDDTISKAQVITATLVGADHFTIKKLRYDCVVIDEAGQALEPACWICILKAAKLILAGDPFQLPPTVKSQEAANGGLGTTLLEKVIALHPAAVSLLEEQYRMNELISSYSSQVFYSGRLHAHASVKDHVLFPGDAPLAFIDTAGCGFDEKIEGTGISNPEEASFVARHLAQYVSSFAGHFEGRHFPAIAVISPYRLQIEELSDQIKRMPELSAHSSNISVNTIDSFQGQERDVVYISMTRSNADSRVGFLSDIRRMNVAMTRAKKKLVVVGDSATLSQIPFYAGFIAYAESVQAYHSAWDFAV